MKKILSILLAATFVLSMAACKKDSKGGENSDIPTLTWLVPGDKQPDIDEVVAEINKITEEKIGAKVDLQFIDMGSFSERMQMNMAAGNDFDICFTGFVNNYLNAVSNGGLLDITDMLEDRPALKEAIPEYAWNAATVGGRISAVPNLQVMATNLCLTVDKAVAEKYDFDWSQVKHIRDIEPFMEMVHGKEPNRYMFRAYYGMNPWIQTKWEDLQGGYVIANDGSSKEVVLKRDTAEFKEAQETLRRWYQKGYIRQDILSVGDDSTDYRAGKYIITCSSAGPGSQATLEAEIGMDLILVNITEPYMKKGTALAAMTGIGANSKHPEKALELIELVNTDKELFNLIAFGIKDKHYTLNEEGKVVYVENSGYAPKTDWVFGNQFNAMLIEGMQDGIWEETAALNLSAKQSPIIAFQFDTDPVKTELSQFSAIGDEFNAMNNGADAPENYMDNWIKKCKAAGQEKIGAELQKQIDAFWETK